MPRTTAPHAGAAQADPAMTDRVFLGRHGRKALNPDGWLHGHLDPPLDEVGLGEAAAVAAKLWEWRIVAILSSPLLRALETASAVAEAVRVTLTPLDDLIDRDFGPWAGKLEAAVAITFGLLAGLVSLVGFGLDSGTTSTSSSTRC